ncbi:MAG: hypothetical protein RBR05_02425 [Candidatus Methanomethylophilaceae archaeon]|jgi:hypothetical protein|nr:hypothetical protein [Candidatus Methanomethylophilaceae archaeon]MDD3069368.1 hypothetical protein [Bacilli bacterium]MDY0224241.1 hypothetical protein [Candidatus Methanomethylophilaceae archaeon]MDY3202102.1 hypothetical protein [Methanocorpusculum sp.]
MDYLILVDYQSDAERKRIDYAIERWKDKGKIHKTKGTVIHYAGDDVDDFLDDLYSRLSVGTGSVHIFAGDIYSPDINEQTTQLKYTTTIDSTAVENFLKYLMNKLGASFEGTKQGIKSYTAYTKKGQAGIDVTLTAGDKTAVLVVVRGYGDVVSFIAGRIDKELKVFLEVE